MRYICRDDNGGNGQTSMHSFRLFFLFIAWHFKRASILRKRERNMCLPPICLYVLSKESYISITQSGSSRKNGGRAGHNSLCYHRAATHEATRVISRLWLVQVLSFMKSFSWLLRCLCRICKTRSR